MILSFGALLLPGSLGLAADDGKIRATGDGDAVFNTFIFDDLALGASVLI